VIWLYHFFVSSDLTYVQVAESDVQDQHLFYSLQGNLPRLIQLELDTVRTLLHLARQSEQRLIAGGGVDCSMATGLGPLWLVSCLGGGIAVDLRRALQFRHFGSLRLWRANLRGRLYLCQLRKCDP